MTIMQNSNKITKMRNSIIITLYNCTNFQYEESRHLFYQREKIAGVSGSHINQQEKKHARKN